MRPNSHPNRRRSGGCRLLPATLGAGLAVLVGALNGASPPAAAPRPPVFPALELGLEHLDAGELLLGELNCVACHTAPPPVLARLNPKPGPLLGGLAARLKPGYVRSWLLDPLAVKPGTTMPDVLHELPPSERAAAAEELTHFLWSLGNAAPAAAAPAGSLQVQQGRALYHQVGCVACHAPFEAAAAIFGHATGGPTDPEAVQFTLRRLQDTSVPLPNLAAKYQPAALAAFLLDPAATRPAGRMPSLKLTEAEARAIAAYLITEHAGQSPAGPDESFGLDRAKARRGRDRFAQLGCAACHELGAGLPGVKSTLNAKSLGLLDTNSPASCLLAAPPVGTPRFALSDAQRAALAATLARRETLAAPRAAPAQVEHTLAGLDCYACHSRDGYGGPGPSRSDYFTSYSEADLGDEGRLPPHLGGVGAKLRADWLGEVLTNRAVVRPYMAVRMPQFGAKALGTLASQFRAADLPAPAPAPAPAGDAAAGRELAGLTGNGCITCHTFGPYPSLGISVMDLTRMARRLEWDWFRRYLEEPASLRPGTRMPSFWPEGRAAVTNLAGGDTARQIAALWAYLNQGTNAAPPPGLLDNLGKPRPAAAPNYE